MSSRALGVGRYQGFVLMVRGTFPGDVIRAEVMEIRKSFAFARLETILSPSPDRVAPFCPAAGICGGCPLQGLAYDQQLTWKRERVRWALAKVQGLRNTDIPAVLGSPRLQGFRNKGQFPVRVLEGATALGFFEAGSHKLVKLDACPVQLPAIDKLIKPVTALIGESGIEIYDEEMHSGELRHVVMESSASSISVVITLVTRSSRVSRLRELAANLMTLPDVHGVVHNVQEERSNVILGRRMVLMEGSETIEETICSRAFLRSAGGFFQVNPFQAAHLAEAVRRLAEDENHRCAVDLYAGVGIFACLLAPRLRSTVGVEIANRAVEFGRINASRFHLDSIDFIHADADSGLGVLPEGTSPDLVVLDPPRRGISGRLARDLNRAPTLRRIIYVSCHPESLARDLKRLSKGKFHVRSVECMDLFPHTIHVETVADLVRTPDQY